MKNKKSDDEIKHNRAIIWEQIRSLGEVPIYPAIVQQMLISAKEESYYDRDLDYDEKYTEWLELRQGFIVAHFEEKGQLLGIGDCVILDVEKNSLIRAPRVTRCGLVLPMIPYQGFISQPKDYITYFESMKSFIEDFDKAAIKKSLRR